MTEEEKKQKEAKAIESIRRKAKAFLDKGFIVEDVEKPQK